MISRAARRNAIKRIFPQASWLWDKIPNSPVLHTNSAAWATMVANGGVGHIADLHEFGVTVVHPGQITSATPTYDITFIEPWGADPFGSDTVHIPAGVTVPAGDDGHVVIIDPLRGKAYGLWQANNASGWSASWGGVAPLSGDGVDLPGGKSTAGRLSRWAGVVLIDELVAAAKANTGLRHAVFFSSSFTAPSFVPPAADTDGVSGQIPIGTRLQLDPTVNVDAVSGITLAEKVIAKTLQTHGGYIADSSEAPMALICEDIPGDPGDAYVALGFEWDYFDMTHIPWSSIRFLRQWDGNGPATNISLVGAVSAATTSVALPAHQAGDLIVAFAYRDGNNTAPALPAGFTNRDNSGANTNSARVGIKYAKSASETSGVWTNATGLVVLIYRGANAGAIAVGGGAASTITYPALTLQKTDGTSWAARFAGHRTATNLTTNTPSGYTARTGVATEVCSSDTDGPIATNPTSATQSVSASSGFRAVTLELRERTKANTLVDLFATQDTTKWSFDAGSVTSGQYAVAPNTNYAGITSMTVYDLTSSQICVEMVQPPNVGNGSTSAWFFAGDDQNGMGFIWENGTLYMRERVTGADSDTELAYNNTTHRWLRIRESAGTSYWETSPNGTTWTAQRSKASGAVLKALPVFLSAGYWGTEPTPGTAIFDNINNPPA